MNIIPFLKATFERLVTAQTLPPILHDVAFLTGALTIAWWFRSPIENLFNRVMSNKNKVLGNTVFGPHARSSPPPPNQVETPESNPEHGPIEYYKSAHFYWLGSDLMSAIVNVAFVPDKETTIQNLTQSLRHFKKSGLKDTAVEERIKWLIDVNQRKLASDWNKEESREDVLKEVTWIRDRISQLIDREAAPQFKPFED